MEGELMDAEHTTVKWFYERVGAATAGASGTELDAQWLRRLCLDAGADDVGFVEVDRPELADQRADIAAVFPRAQTLVSFVCRMNRENIRSPARSVSNLEFHHAGDEVNDVARQIVAELGRQGIRALNPVMELTPSQMMIRFTRIMRSRKQPWHPTLPKFTQPAGNGGVTEIKRLGLLGWSPNSS
jgi:hypothetical protein